MSKPRRPKSAPPAHPIQVAARRAGLSADVLRAWERRYRLVTPLRSAHGRRLYSDGDVERLRLIAVAARAGRRITDLASLSNGELARLVADDQASASPRSERSRTADMLDEAGAAVAALDARALRSVLNRALVALPAIAFVDEIVEPLMRSIGERWSHGELSPAHEHLATGVLQRVLREVTDALVAEAAGPMLVVAAPAGQRHEIGAMTVALAAALEGWRVTQLGADLPAADIAHAALQVQASAISLSLTSAVEGTGAELHGLREQVGARLPILAGGRAAEGLSQELATAGVRRLRDLAALRAALPTLAPP